MKIVSDRVFMWAIGTVLVALLALATGTVAGMLVYVWRHALA